MHRRKHVRRRQELDVCQLHVATSLIIYLLLGIQR